MAKPIKSTPHLIGVEANEFLKKMIEIENSRTTYQQKEFARKIEKNMKELGEK